MYEREYILQVFCTRTEFPTVVNAYAKAGLPAEAERIFKQMLDAGITANQSTYNTLAKAYAQAERPAEAERIIKRMLAGGITPDQITYSTLGNAYAQAGRPAEAEGIFKRMLDAGIKADHWTYSTLVNAYMPKLVYPPPPSGYSNRCLTQGSHQTKLRTTPWPMHMPELKHGSRLNRAYIMRSNLVSTGILKAFSKRKDNHASPTENAAHANGHATVAISPLAITVP